MWFGGRAVCKDLGRAAGDRHLAEREERTLHLLPRAKDGPAAVEKPLIGAARAEGRGKGGSGEWFRNGYFERRPACRAFSRHGPSKTAVHRAWQ
jgi:hypothetical protein